MPVQRPHRSEQSVGTPPEFIKAAEHYLSIKSFAIDLAASFDNRVCTPYITRERNTLNVGWADEIPMRGWGWLNPEYRKITPWVKKARYEQRWLKNYSGIAVLVPASTGSNWWRDWVHNKARVLLLNGRVTFVGHTTGYPRDLALLLYSQVYAPGYEVWSWKREQT